MSYVGKRVVRQDATDKVRGRARYADDLSALRMLHGATARSAVPHGRITSIDTSEAEAAPGVVAVLTARDLPAARRLPLVVDDYPFLAEDRVRFVGQPIALVAARSRGEARAAAALVRVEVEPLEAVFDPREALRPGAPAVGGDGNAFKRFTVRKGDSGTALSEECDVVVEGVFETGHQVHAYLETQGMVVEPDGMGGLVVHGSMQCPYYVLDAVAAATGIARNAIQVVQAETGGAFGGKEDVPSIVASHAALLARATGRPVKLVYDREEDFASMSKRHPGWARVRYGATRDGDIRACEVEYVIDGGAYATLSPIVLFRGAAHAAGPYDIPHVTVEAVAAATNTVPCGAFRGFGQPQIAFAQESAIDLLAERLEMDPLELRARNVLGRGSSTATGQQITESCGLPEALERVRAASGWSERRGALGAGPERRRGLGAATAYYGVGLGAGGRHIDRAGAAILVEKDGSVQVSVGNTEMGQGARSELAQIAADALGAPLDAVRVRPVDTSRVPDSGPTVASRTTISSGKAILAAASPIRGRIEGVARRLLGAPEVTVEEGLVRAGDRELPFAEVVAACYGERQPMSSVGTWVSPETSFDAEGQGDAYAVYSYSATVAEVEVDLGTGEVEVLDVWTAVDVGRAVNPDQVEAQLEGGVVQATGYALMEELHLVEGRIENPDLGRYIIPTPLDVPRVHPIVVESHYGDGPYGAKGFGEIPMIGTPAAIASAVAHALGGTRPRALPVTPERVLDLLGDEGGGREAS